jgi:hypothetical protein
MNFNEICYEYCATKNINILVFIFEVLRIVTITTAVFWDVTPFTDVSEKRTASILRVEK